MKKKNYWIRFSVLLVLIRFFSMVPVSAKWIINPSLGQDDTLNIGGITNDASKRVAYIEGDKDELGFTTIEAALAKATQKGGSQKVVVVPGMNPVIKHNCVVSNNVTLVVPYGNAKSPVTQFANVVNSDFALLNASPDCILTIDDQVKVLVDNGGKILVNGQVGANSSNPGHSSGIGRTTGCTFGQHAAIYRSSSSSIEIKGGSMDCWGLIREVTKSVDYLDRVSYKLTDGLNSSSNSSLISVDGGTINLPFTVYDWQGGANSVCMIAGKDAGSVATGAIGSLFGKSEIFPMQKFDCPNIYCMMKFKNNGARVGTLSVIMDSSIQSFSETLIGQKGLIQYSGGSVVWDFENPLLKSNKMDFLQNMTNHKTLIKASGGSASVGSFSVTLVVKGIPKEISTADFLLPIGPQFNLYISDKCSFNIDNKIKLLPNCVFTIESGSTCTVTSNFLISYFSSNGEISSQAFLYNNGSLEFKGNRDLKLSYNRFGGYVTGNKGKLTQGKYSSFSGQWYPKEHQKISCYFPQYGANGQYLSAVSYDFTLNNVDVS